MVIRPQIRAIALFAVFTIAAAILMRPSFLAAQQPTEIEKRMKARSPHWDPPDVDAPFHSRSSSLPCELSSVLQQAQARAEDLITNLQNFTAQERIKYVQISNLSRFLDGDQGTFDYTAVLMQQPGGLAVQESRVPERGSHLFPASTQDVGLPEMALIFGPDLEGDYEMKCDGSADWNGQPTWVVHFQQRKDKESHTVSFGGKDAVHPAKLKGRAWIAQDSGEVMHLETGLVEALPAIHVREWYLSIDYAPVQFHTKDVRVWLPQSVDAYCDYGAYRTIIYHTFTDFLLFSVRTNQDLDEPKKP
jgi:hypothetical protein